jgi:hypothetical protein
MEYAREQCALLLAQKKQVHNAREKNLAQKIVVSISSLFYLAPCFASSEQGDTFGVVIWVLVTLMSALADGGWVEGMPILQLIDKWTATTGGLYIIVPKLWPYAHAMVTVQMLLGALISVFWLVQARRTQDTWLWVFYQSMWHAVSGLTVAKACYCYTDGTGCPLFF